MSGLASAATATVLAFGIAVALEAQPVREPKLAQVQQHGSPGAARVELAERAGAAAATATVDACEAGPAGAAATAINSATRKLSAWPAISDVLGVEHAEPPRAGDLVNLALGPPDRCDPGPHTDLPSG